MKKKYKKRKRVTKLFERDHELGGSLPFGRGMPVEVETYEDGSILFDWPFECGNQPTALAFDKAQASKLRDFLNDTLQGDVK